MAPVDYIYGVKANSWNICGWISHKYRQMCRSVTELLCHDWSAAWCRFAVIRKMMINYMIYKFTVHGSKFTVGVGSLLGWQYLNHHAKKSLPKTVATAFFLPKLNSQSFGLPMSDLFFVLEKTFIFICYLIKSNFHLQQRFVDITLQVYKYYIERLIDDNYGCLYNYLHKRWLYMVMLHT